MKGYQYIQIITAIIIIIAGCNRKQSQEQAKIEESFVLNYDDMIILDAEHLGEGGIVVSYEKDIIPVLQRYVDTPVVIFESLDAEDGVYKVLSQGKTYLIASPETEVGENWGNATVALFEIVNHQLQDSEVRFYAINGGNDLGGMFLSEEAYNLAVNTYKRKQDWPYIPRLDPPWYGQPHEN